MLRIQLKESGRLDRVLRKAEIPGKEWLSRGSWESMFEQGLVCDERGRKLSGGSQQDAGTTIQLSLPVLLGILPSTESLSPLWCFEDLALFDKPPGIASYPLFPWDKGCFANRVCTWLSQSNRMSALDFSLLSQAPLLEGGLTQRLDRDTSGALLVAFSKAKKAELRAEFSAHRMRKTYFALVYGDLKDQEITLYTWAETQKKMGAGKDPKKPDAQRVNLSCQRLDSKNGISLVSLTTCHGSRHVVRVTLATLGHPLVGDLLYGDSRQDVHSHLLHASKIEPVNGKGCPWPKVQPPKSFLDSCHNFGIEFPHE